jgi:hypothetical protein
VKTYSNSPTTLCSENGSNPIVVQCTVSLPGSGDGLTPGTQYTLVVQAQGEPTITNHLSNNSVNYTP